MRWITPLIGLMLAAAPLGAQAPRGSDRPADGLLARAELQRIVDLQAARGGAALVAALGDSDPAVRARAAFALASVQDTAAVPALLERLGDSDALVRADAAFALGQTALPAPPDAAFRATVARGLVDALVEEEDPAARRRLIEALGKTGGAESIAALATLRGADRELPDLALAVARYGLRDVFDPAAAARLAALLEHSDPEVREAAAYPLGRWRDPASWSGIAGAAVRAATDAAFEPRERGDAAPEGPAPGIQLVAALGRLGDPADTPGLARWLAGAGDWRERVAAARALGARTDEEAARSALYEALGDPSVHVAVAAAAALAGADSLPDPLVHDLALSTMLHRAEWRVAGELLPALARAGVDNFIILWLMWLDTEQPENAAARAKALRALGQGRLGPGFLVLENQATWENPRVAAAAIEGLAARWRRGVVDTLATRERYYRAFALALERGDVAIVSEAAPALADSAFAPLGAAAALAAAARALELPRDREAMMAIADALERMGDPAAATLRAELEKNGAEDSARRVDWAALARLGPMPRLVLETERGRMVLALDPGEAPLTVQTIARLAVEGRFDGVPFHRVVPNFVIQAGDVSRGDGYGGPGFEIVSEFTRRAFRRGTLGMASAGKDTEGSQFFITHSMQPHLDGRYTAFGELVEGGDVLDTILEGDRIVRARIEAAPARD